MKIIYLRKVSEDGKQLLDSYYKVEEIDKYNTSITEVSDGVILFYDTRISRSLVEEKFNYLKAVEIIKKDFDKKILEILDKKENK